MGNTYVHNLLAHERDEGGCKFAAGCKCGHGLSTIRSAETIPTV